LEFYTPTGLHAKDASESYAGRYPRQFSIPGIKVTHVDARVAEYRFIDNRWQFTRYVTEAPQQNGIRYDLAHSNTASRSLNPNFKLLHMLESSGNNTFINGGYATDATLFGVGDGLGDYTFNSGIQLGFRFEVISISDTEVVIQFTRV
jgi:hypothetical protein